jgi:NADH-ubiquinone oxidoreductase chain 5
VKANDKLNIDYATVFSLAPYISENIITIIGICLLIGAMAKSSQIGLHVWLPLAISPWKGCKRSKNSN